VVSFGKNTEPARDDLQPATHLSKPKRSRFQFNLTNLFLFTSGVALLFGTRIHTEKYFGKVLLLAGIFAVAAIFVTKILRMPNDGSMRHEFIRDNDSDK